MSISLIRHTLRRCWASVEQLHSMFVMTTPRQWWWRWYSLLPRPHCLSPHKRRSETIRVSGQCHFSSPLTTANSCTAESRKCVKNQSARNQVRLNKSYRCNLLAEKRWKATSQLEDLLDCLKHIPTKFDNIIRSTSSIKLPEFYCICII